MSEPPGLRERKKIRTRRMISEVAIGLFLERGFDQVAVAEVAAAADVSKMTVFNYFPTKEDLVLYRIADHADEQACVVRGRRPGEAPLAALRRHFLACLLRRDPMTGLNDDPAVLAYQRLVMGTPGMRSRLYRVFRESEDSLVEALASAGADELTAQLAAAQLVAVRQTLFLRNLNRILGGKSAKSGYPKAVAEAERAFGLVENGIASTGLAG